jgi:hypothetical protein
VIVLWISVEHLVQWFSSTNVPALQPTAISLDIQNPIIEMKLKQVESCSMCILVDNISRCLSIDLDSFDPRVSSRNNQVLDTLFGKVNLDQTSFLDDSFSFLSHVEHIINETVRLFALGSVLPDASAGRILPLHLVALIDPQANWFRTWMVSALPCFSSLRPETGTRLLNSLFISI